MRAAKLALALACGPASAQGLSPQQAARRPARGVIGDGVRWTGASGSYSNEVMANDLRRDAGLRGGGG